MAKVQKTIRLSQDVIDMVQEVSEGGIGMSWTNALEIMVRSGHLTRSISVNDRDKLRVSCKNGKYSDIYDKHERKMIDFFLV